MVLKRPYRIKATKIINLPNYRGPVIELYSLEGLPFSTPMFLKRLAEQGITLKPFRTQWVWKICGKPETAAERRQMSYYGMFSIEMCHYYCPDASPDMASLEIMRAIDAVNARWLP